MWYHSACCPTPRQHTAVIDRGVSHLVHTMHHMCSPSTESRCCAATPGGGVHLIIVSAYFFYQAIIADPRACAGPLAPRLLG